MAKGLISPSLSSDGLFGEMFGDDGWIEKHSEFDGKDYF